MSKVVLRQVPLVLRQEACSVQPVNDTSLQLCQKVNPVVLGGSEQAVAAAFGKAEASAVFTGAFAGGAAVAAAAANKIGSAIIKVRVMSNSFIVGLGANGTACAASGAPRAQAHGIAATSMAARTWRLYCQRCPAGAKARKIRPRCLFA
ncbi:hypothetical protein [Lysobacter sp. CA199]|uniref:hypothetical protein n=1 Tax=Lysobacter sp. CA199 TaxID=3455608 RepID=UPI003F8D3261